MGGGEHGGGDGHVEGFVMDGLGERGTFFYAELRLLHYSFRILCVNNSNLFFMLFKMIDLRVKN